MKLLSTDNRLRPAAYLLLALLCAVFYIPGQASLPAIDRDEARFAQATKQMVASGDYLDIRYQEEHRYKKPAGIYWLQTMAVKATNAMPTEIWAYRLPSLLSAIGAVLLTAAIGGMLFGGRIGLLAALLLAGSVLMHVESRMAKTDATLLFTILAAQYALLRIWLLRHKHLLTATLFWAALAAGMLLKGPIILIPVLFTLGGLCWRERSGALWKNLQPLIGLPLLLALVLPWFIGITMKTGGEFWAASVGNDLLNKVSTGSERSMIPPGYYLVTFWATFWPACLLVALAIPYIWKQRRNPRVTALLLWVLPMWIVFEAFMTKLPHYTLPTYPALAILAAAAWFDDFAVPRWWQVLCAIAFTIATFVLTLGIALVPLFASHTIMLPQIVVAAMVLAGMIWWLLRGGSLPITKRVAIPTILSGVLLATLFGFSWPQWNYIWVSRSVQTALATETDCTEPRLISARFNEPSLVFTTGTDTKLDATGAEAADFLTSNFCAFALVDQKNMDMFEAQTRQLRIEPREIARIQGFSYGGGDPIDMRLFRATYPAAARPIPAIMAPDEGAE